MKAKEQLLVLTTDVVRRTIVRPLGPRELTRSLITLEWRNVCLSCWRFLLICKYRFVFARFMHPAQWNLLVLGVPTEEPLLNRGNWEPLTASSWRAAFSRSFLRRRKSGGGGGGLGLLFLEVLVPLSASCSFTWSGVANPCDSMASSLW